MEAALYKDPRIVPPPPRLHWAILLALQFLTLGMFGFVWLVVQATWVKRMTGNSKALTWAIINLCALPLAVLLMVLLGSIAEGFRFVILVLNLVAVFTLRSHLENYPINMSLSGGLTFLLGTVYLQYHFGDYVLPDAGDVFGPIPASPAYVPLT